MATATLPRESGAFESYSDQGSDSRLVVTWQHPFDRDISPIGLLSFDGHKYHFRYLRSAPTVEGFRPLLGFPDYEQLYTSETLFQLFAQRAMDARRPDFQRYVEDLGLGEDASPWEQIARSGGSRGSDTLQLFPAPHWVGDGWVCYFLVHGMRHLLEKSVVVGDIVHASYSPGELEQVLTGLSVGEELRVEHEVTNKASLHALLATNSDDDPVGWVPDWLAAEVIQLQSDGCLSFHVDKVNPPEAGWHMRLVVKMHADCPESFEFFAGDAWSTFV
jgi:hypothetical protein